MADDDKPAIEIEQLPPMPPMKESTSEAIFQALHHQYGVECGFVICLLPIADIEMLNRREPGALPERAPRVVVNKTNIGDELGAEMIANVIEAYHKARETAAAMPQGNA